VYSNNPSNGDFGGLVFPIAGIGWRKEYHRNFEGVVIVTPETSFEIEMGRGQ
jgi:hypothetical protein